MTTLDEALMVEPYAEYDIVDDISKRPAIADEPDWQDPTLMWNRFESFLGAIEYQVNPHSKKQASAIQFAQYMWQKLSGKSSVPQLGVSELVSLQSVVTRALYSYYDGQHGKIKNLNRVLTTTRNKVINDINADLKEQQKAEGNLKRQTTNYAKADELIKTSGAIDIDAYTEALKKRASSELSQDRLRANEQLVTRRIKSNHQWFDVIVEHQREIQGTLTLYQRTVETLTDTFKKQTALLNVLETHNINYEGHQLATNWIERLHHSVDLTKQAIDQTRLKTLEVSPYTGYTIEGTMREVSNGIMNEEFKDAKAFVTRLYQPQLPE